MKVTRKLGIMFAMVLALILILPAAGVQATHDATGVPYAVGDVFAGIGHGQVAHYAPDGTLKHTLDSGLGFGETTGMAFDASGNLYVSFFSNSRIAKFDNVGNLVSVFPYAFASHPESISFNAAGDFYVGTADGLRDIYKFDQAGNLLAQYNPTTGPRGSDWIDLAADQNTIFYTSEGNLVRRFDIAANATIADFATLPSSPGFALRIRSNNEVLVAATSQVVRLNPDGSVNQTYPKPVGESSFLFAMNLDPDGNSFWTAGYSTGNIYKYDINTGAITANFTAPTNPTLAGLAVFGEPTQGNPSETEASIDIKPTSCPNPLNVAAKGVLPVAILGTDTFDVSQVDLATVQLEGVSPLRWSMEDVATPFEGEISDPAERNDCTTAGPDGFSDLTLKFDTQEIVAALGAVNDGDVLVLTLTGELLDGTPFSGQDVIWIRKKK